MKEQILQIYKQYHSGKEKAITRAKFMEKNSWRLPEMTDRQFRAIYSQLPIVTCEKGGFYPTCRVEIDEYRKYLHKKAISLFERFQRVCIAHPDLAGDIDQLELF